MVVIEKSLKYIVTIQSALGVSRKWTFSDEHTWKGLFTAVFWTASSIAVAFTIGKYLKFFKVELSERAINISSWLSLGNTVLTIIWACATSKQFKELLFHLSETQLQLEHYPEYTRKRSNLYAVVAIMLIVLLVVNATGSCASTIMRMKAESWETPFIFHWINLVNVACLIRAGVEYLLFYCILKVLSLQLEFIAFDATEITRKLRSTASEEDDDYTEHAESLGKLCTCYIHTYESCRLINIIFSLPTSTSFGILVMYHIVIVYVQTSPNLIVGVTVHMTVLYVVMLLPNILALVTIAVAGQSVHNNADAITRALAYLLLVTTNAEDNLYRATRRATRVAAARPLRLVIFGFSRLGNALIPASLAYFTTYLIIALQLNNVL